MFQRQSYIKCFFDEKATDWDQRNHYNPALVTEVLDRLNILPNSRILDVGCGTGVLFPQLLGLNPKFIHGLDLSESMVRIAEKKYTDPRIQVFTEDFYQFSGTGYDFVVMYNAYPHFWDRDKLAFQMRKCLRPNGRMLILHGAGREKINRCHLRYSVEISKTLSACQEEIRYFLPYFCIDGMEDTPARYFFSGTAK